MESGRPWWIPAVVLVLALLVLAAAWRYTPMREWFDIDRLADTLEPYRTSWLAMPATLLVFVVAELLMFPVLVLIFACGIVFGPWLGAVYALAGAVASALIPFAVGRRLGHEAVARRGGALVRKVEHVLDRRGVIAVFLVRKIPAPFTLVNIVCGASSVSLRDFTLGTLLGMGTGVILLTLLGGQLFVVARQHDPWQIGGAVVLLFAPLLIALLVQRLLNRRAGSQR